MLTKSIGSTQRRLGVGRGRGRGTGRYWVIIVFFLFFLGILAFHLLVDTVSAQDVTPWEALSNRAQQLREEAAIIGHYRGDGHGGYVGGCAGPNEKGQIRTNLEEAIQIGERIRDDYGQAEQGNYIIQVVRKQLDYSMSLPPCSDSGKVGGGGVTPAPAPSSGGETPTLFPPDGVAGGLSLFVVKPVASVLVAAAVAQFFLVVRIMGRLKASNRLFLRRRPSGGSPVRERRQLPVELARHRGHAMHLLRLPPRFWGLHPQQ